MEDCGLPLRARPALRNDAQWWELIFYRIAGPLVSDLSDPAAALALLSGGYRPNTDLSYMSKCRAFLSYRAGADRDPLPATPATMVGYVLHKLKRGALAPPFLVK